MAHYKRDAASNRDALFGGASSGGKKVTSSGRPGGSSAKPSRPQQQQQSSRPAASTAAAAAAASSAVPRLPTPSYNNASSLPTDSTITPGPSTIFSGKISSRHGALSLLTGQAKIDKMAEAEDYRLKAKKAMTRGVFSRPDPIAAGNYYKRAADAYKQCGEHRLERLHRIASGDVQMGQDAFATAASEYTRAAELAEISDETLARKRQECHKLHLDAANAWSQMGEKGRCAESTMKAAFGLVMGEDATKPLEPKALASVEEAIETFVPDPLNRKSNYRRTGHSAYHDPNAPDPESAKRNAMALAKQNIINDSFAHEIIFQVGAELIRRRHYESALYAYGAGTATLEHEGFATVSLGRAYLSETIITLAMGDTIAAKQDFMNVHLQRTSYLSSRECALAEDLVRACDAMDLDALEETRARSGQHRSAMANLEPVVRDLVGEIRVSGRAKKEKAKVKPAVGVGASAAAQTRPAVAQPPAARAPSVTKASTKPPTPEKERELSGEELQQSLDAGFGELDDIMGEMGLGDDDDDDDDDIDLT